MQKFDAIHVFSQTEKKRVYVGKLWREKKSFRFEYSKDYQNSKSAVALGPEFPVWKTEFSSQALFPSLQERIPSRQNPAFKEYCNEWGIDENEKDEFLLLATIGRRGPSTFIFEPYQEKNYSGETLKSFRVGLDLNQAEFETLFGVSHLTLVRLENSTSQNPLYLRYFQVFDEVPEALAWLIEKRGEFLHDNKKAKILKSIKDSGSGKPL
jgi:HipA-like protein